jgi:hypothetical protein
MEEQMSTDNATIEIKALVRSHGAGEVRELRDS